MAHEPAQGTADNAPVNVLTVNAGQPLTPA